MVHAIRYQYSYLNLNLNMVWIAMPGVSCLDPRSDLDGRFMGLLAVHSSHSNIPGSVK